MDDHPLAVAGASGLAIGLGVGLLFQQFGVVAPTVWIIVVIPVLAAVGAVLLVRRDATRGDDGAYLADRGDTTPRQDG